MNIYVKRQYSYSIVAMRIWWALCGALVGIAIPAVVIMGMGCW